MPSGSSIQMLPLILESNALWFAAGVATVIPNLIRLGGTPSPRWAIHRRAQWQRSGKTAECYDAPYY